MMAWLRTVYIFRPLKFKNEKERQEYYRLIRNVKKVYPISREINQAIIETYEYLQTLPNEKARQQLSNENSLGNWKNNISKRKK